LDFLGLPDATVFFCTSNFQTPCIVPKVLETAKINVIFEEVSESTELKSFSSFSSSNSSNESMTTPDFSPTSQEITDDALEYIAGYMAKKYKDKIPNLGQFTHKLKADFHGCNNFHTED
jgi:hypothetical protein